MLNIRQHFADLSHGNSDKSYILSLLPQYYCQIFVTVAIPMPVGLCLQFQFEKYIVMVVMSLPFYSVSIASTGTIFGMKQISGKMPLKLLQLLHLCL